MADSYTFEVSAEDDASDVLERLDDRFDDFDAGMEESGETASQFSQILSAELVSNGLMSVTEWGKQAAQSVATWTKQAARGAERIERLSETTGANRQQVQRLENVYRRAGLEADSLRDNIFRLSERMTEAQRRSGGMRDDMLDAGFTMEEMARLTEKPDKALESLLENIKQAPSRMEAMSRAEKTLGGESQRLVTFLRSTDRTIDDLIEGAGEYGSVLSDSAIKQQAELNEQMEQFKGAWRTFKADMVTSWVPSIVDQLNWLERSMEGPNTKIDEMQGKIADQQGGPSAGSDIQALRKFLFQQGRDSFLDQTVGRAVSSVAGTDTGRGFLREGAMAQILTEGGLASEREVAAASGEDMKAKLQRVFETFSRERIIDLLERVERNAPESGPRANEQLQTLLDNVLGDIEQRRSAEQIVDQANQAFRNAGPYGGLLPGGTSSGGGGGASSGGGGGDGGGGDGPGRPTDNLTSERVNKLERLEQLQVKIAEAEGKRSVQLQRQADQLEFQLEKSEILADRRAGEITSEQKRVKLAKARSDLAQDRVETDQKMNDVLKERGEEIADTHEQLKDTIDRFEREDRQIRRSFGDGPEGYTAGASREVRRDQLRFESSKKQERQRRRRTGRSLQAAGRGLSQVPTRQAVGMVKQQNSELRTQIRLYGKMTSVVGKVSGALGTLVDKQWKFSEATSASRSAISALSSAGKVAGALAKSQKQRAQFRGGFEAAAAAAALAAGIAGQPRMFASAAKHSLASGMFFALAESGKLKSKGSGGAGAGGAGGGFSAPQPSFDIQKIQRDSAEALAQEMQQQRDMRPNVIRVDLRGSRNIQDSAETGKMVTDMVESHLGKVSETSISTGEG